ncbi:hypothetical protein HZ996_10840 [Cryomorphaceae bacterium]|nr:hypothetical protein HZ996_10840 [Cryomorphaceae bacterium]
MSREHHHLLLSNLASKNQRGERRINPKKAAENGALSFGRPQLEYKYSERSFGPMNPLRVRRFIGQLDETISRKKHRDKPVVFYIPGWNHKALVTLDLFRELSHRYSGGAHPAVGSFIFFQWMTGEFSDIINKRHQIDDGAWDQAQECGQMLEHLLIEVSDHLKRKGIPFYLMTHSYAHQFLNSLLQVWGENDEYETIFDKAFLFAPDITWKSMHQSPGGKGGVKLVNPNQDLGDDYRHFDLTPLQYVAKQTHVLSCSWDYLLHHSQSMNLMEVMDYAEKKDLQIKPVDYVGLGVSASLWKNPGVHLPEGIQVHEVFNLLEPVYQKVVRDQDRVVMESFFEGSVPKNFQSALKVALRAGRWADLHRYVFLSDGVHQFLREELKL